MPPRSLPLIESQAGHPCLGTGRPLRRRPPPQAASVHRFLRRPTPPAPQTWPSVTLLQPAHPRRQRSARRPPPPPAGLAYRGHLQHILICDVGDGATISHLPILARRTPEPGCRSIVAPAAHVIRHHHSRPSHGAAPLPHTPYPLRRARDAPQTPIPTLSPPRSKNSAPPSPTPPATSSPSSTTISSSARTPSTTSSATFRTPRRRHLRPRRLYQLVQHSLQPSERLCQRQRPALLHPAHLPAGPYTITGPLRPAPEVFPAVAGSTAWKPLRRRPRARPPYPAPRSQRTFRLL